MAEQAARHLRMVIPAAPWTAAMEDGSVAVPGLTWEIAPHIAHAPERFVATREQAADVGEDGLRRYIIALEEGAPPTAIPVFFIREYMVRNLLVREDSPLSSPADLAGKRIGGRISVVSGTCAAVLMMLEQAYGVDLTSLELRMEEGRFPTNRMGLNMQPFPENNEVALEQLLKGELDAVIMTTGPRYRSLFGGDGLEEVVAANPGIRTLVSDPDSIVDAFSQANDLAHRHRDADEQAMADRELAMLGHDPYRYELGADQHLNLQAYTDFFYRMGAIERSVDAEKLFVPSTVR